MGSEDRNSEILPRPPKFLLQKSCPNQKVFKTANAHICTLRAKKTFFFKKRIFLFSHCGIHTFVALKSLDLCRPFINISAICDRIWACDTIFLSKDAHLSN